MQASYVFQESKTENSGFCLDYFKNVIDQPFQMDLYHLDSSLRSGSTTNVSNNTNYLL